MVKWTLSTSGFHIIAASVMSQKMADLVLASVADGGLNVALPFTGPFYSYQGNKSPI